MDRTAPPRPRVDLATPGDDPAIRELLRRQVMEGTLRLTLEREPELRLAASVEGVRHHTVVARHPGGKLIGMGSRAVRRVWVNGRPALVGYLAQLRREPGWAGARRLVAEGYRVLEETRRDDELPFDLTAIVVDNRPARRLLERGLPGLPIYRPISELVTLTLNTRASKRPSRVLTGDEGLLDPIVDCLRRNLSRYQLAPAVTADDLRSPERSRGLSPGDFLVVPGRDGDRRQVLGCLALWDQRTFKQVVVRGYRPPLDRLRPWLNVPLALGRRPRLPVPGTPLRLAFLSYLAVDDEREDVAIDLIRAGLGLASRRGLDYVSLALAGAHHLLPAVRASFAARELRSILYLVHRDAARSTVAALDHRCPHVEIATL